MLTQRFPPDVITDSLIPLEQWHPYPVGGERDAWAGLPHSARQARVKRGERAMEEDWEALPASLFLQYARMGNRRNYEAVRDRRRGRLGNLVVAECMEGEGRFLDAIVDGIWLTCEETYWGIPAHVGVQKAGSGLPDAFEPTVDLFAGETVSLLAWTLYLLGPALDEVSPLVARRLRLESERRVLVPCLERDDFWWMGFDGRRVNNWNPWCNSNWLTAALLLEQDAVRRAATVVRIMDSLDRFIDPYPLDGGCDEGPGYWGRAGASLYDCLELLYSATGGAVDVYDEPLIQNIGRYIYRVQIADRYFVNFADAPALVETPPGVVYGYGRRIADPQLTQLGVWALQQHKTVERGAGYSLGRELPLLFSLESMTASSSTAPLPRDTWLPQIQVMTARDEEGSDRGLYLAAKGGHNEESHNHNDVGHFIVYVDGRPALVDVGVETYSAKTFSSNRYDIWTMQSAYHSLPTVNGVMQAPGRQYAATAVSYSADDAQACLELDLAPAYPETAGIISWKRVIRQLRGDAVELHDEYQLRDAPSSLELSLMTPCTVVAGTAELILRPRELTDGRTSGGAVIALPPGLSVRVEERELSDAQLCRAWGASMTRIVLTAEQPAASGAWDLRITALNE
ncbi:heparinase II/III family protein [Candidatus Latescibacterota bacterium]